MTATRNGLSAAWGSAGAMSGAPAAEGPEEVNGLSAAWGSAGAMSGPPQLKGLKK
jgi:hypothetical protein